jgi:hypothetical protein
MAIAPVVFTPGTMPRMYVMDVLSQNWVHRDVSAITQPVITWNLNGADTFTCTFTPPRSDLLDNTGNPLFNEWQHACFLEQGNDILFGGILLSSQISGPQWQTTWQGYGGYPNGIPYEGPSISETNLEALDAVRYIWQWLQGQPDGDLHLNVERGATGVLLGAQQQSVPAQTTLNESVNKGANKIRLQNVNAHDGFPAFATGMTIDIVGDQYKIKSIDKASRYVTLTSNIKVHRNAGRDVTQVVPLNPFVLDWRNSTDCGQEISSIQQEAVFDWIENHRWDDSSKRTMHHSIRFGIPRRGTRRTEIRFVEGENLFQQSQVTRDGTTFAQNVVGLGAGQGRYMIRTRVGERNGRLRRVHVYQDATVKNTARMTSKATRVLRSLINPDTPTSVVVRDHLNAPFGSFGVGDDVLISLITGWQNRSTWCRITSMSQDPTTNLISLTMVRSDSYTYMAQSGQAGTI